jgi:hypothetical protein
VGLTENKKEQTITLNPSGDSTKYIKAVQKLLASQILQLCNFLEKMIVIKLDII